MRRALSLAALGLIVTAGMAFAAAPATDQDAADPAVCVRWRDSVVWDVSGIKNPERTCVYVYTPIADSGRS